MAALSDDQLWSLTSKYFGDLGQDVVALMFNIAKRESGGNPGVVNQNAATRDDSHGLWQINIRPDANPQFASWNLSDPEQNAMAARQLFDAAGPTPWSTYQAAAADVAGGGGIPLINGYESSPLNPYQRLDMSGMSSVGGPHSEWQTATSQGITPEQQQAIDLAAVQASWPTLGPMLARQTQGFTSPFWKSTEALMGAGLFPNVINQDMKQQAMASIPLVQSPQPGKLPALASLPLVGSL